MKKGSEWNSLSWKKVIENPQYIQLKDFSNVSEERTQKAINKLDIEKEISEEIQWYGEGLEELNRMLWDI